MRAELEEAQAAVASLIRSVAEWKERELQTAQQGASCVQGRKRDSFVTPREELLSVELMQVYSCR